MVFHFNPCSNALMLQNDLLLLNRRIIYSIILIEMAIILVFRLISALKNEQISFMKSENLRRQLAITKLASLSTENGGLKISSQGSKGLTMEIQSKHKILLNDELINNNGQNCLEHNSQSSQSQDSNIIQQDIKNVKQTQAKQFINICNLKIGIQQFITIINFLLGHSFIAMSTCLINFPYIYSSILGLVHLVLFIFLLIFNMIRENNNAKLISERLENPNNNKKSMQIVITCFTTNTVENLHQNSNNNQKNQNNQQSAPKLTLLFESKLNKLVFAIICVMNIVWLAMGLFGLKMSYIDVENSKCLY